MTDLNPFLDPALLREVEAFIINHWDETVRTEPRDEGTLIGLPFPYTIPSRKGSFQELYYWDTYFTCIGLLRSGRHELALANTRNLLSLVERYGFVPNGNRTFYLTRSQPPYLALLVTKVAGALQTPELLRTALPALRREYEFWMTKRLAPTGLNHYGHHADRDYLFGEFYDEVAARAHLPESRTEAFSRLTHTLAECESGADFTPRFENRCLDFCPVDLNCLLHFYEHYFAAYGEEGEKNKWLERAAQRLERINQFCWDEERGGFFDYDFVNGRPSSVLAGWFLPLWLGIATEKQAALAREKILPQLEYPFGLAACAPATQRDRPYQWDYPNGWPCLQLIAYEGFHRYGQTEIALRIARKYLASVARSFQKTGDLWEKYNVENGSVDTVTESGYGLSAFRDGKPSTSQKGVEVLPAMMGWTGGVFLDALTFSRENTF